MQDFWLCLSAFVAGAINSVAGGGTLLTFPALDWSLGGSDVAAVAANATSTVALLPGSIGGMWGYRRDFVGTRRWLKWLLPPSIAGGLIGAYLLVAMPAQSFKYAVPWLILTASTLFTIQPWIAKKTGIGQPHSEPAVGTMMVIAAFQLLVSIYGGYFGAGIGILMLSALAMMGLADIHRMNALKSLFGTCINGLAAALFIVKGQVHWRFAIPMAIAAVLGGVGGAMLARRMDRRVVRWTVIVVGFSLAIYYFLKTWKFFSL
ncbi:MAG TPA: sulfite exporter TauE/SafE family protein [Planctomycetaceae bacterium]|nr:sulfite exporter TauE/SafE family protein [Planctomycetaceae bacterium]